MPSVKSYSGPLIGSVLAVELICEMPQKPSFVMGVEVGAELVENPEGLAQAAQEDWSDLIFYDCVYTNTFHVCTCS